MDGLRSERRRGHSAMLKQIVEYGHRVDKPAAESSIIFVELTSLPGLTA